VTPGFHAYRWIVVNSSGGKDSQAALGVVVAEADRQAYDRARIVVSHQCLGPMEWPGTVDLVREHARAYGLRCEVTKYRNRDGVELTLLDYIRKRGKWPSNKQRFCTSDFKRGPGRRVIVKLFMESPGDILQIFGFRADESPARAKKQVFSRNPVSSTQSRTVHDWLPIHHWTEAQVWESIKASGIPHHPAYDKGMSRLSCCFCIFAPKPALMIAGRENPELLRQYVEVEREIGHDFQHGKPIREIKEAIERGDQPAPMDGRWNM
jgi:3'-phosphoadenosine 5'-phosphosulfate sulfotransferase (PAPS reductase)/FAD synthetase